MLLDLKLSKLCAAKLVTRHKKLESTQGDDSAAGVDEDDSTAHRIVFLRIRVQMCGYGPNFGQEAREMGSEQHHMKVL